MVQQRNPHFDQGVRSGNVLFGRNYDIEKITEMLDQSGCRLISLVGSGGIGKTQLAKQIARVTQASFGDGVYFVQLQPVTSSEFVIPAIIETLGQGLHGSEAPEIQLQRYLEDKEILLILDNFEHLLEAVDQLIEILEGTSKVKILLTTREVLNVSYEWVWKLAGLAYPQSADSDDLDQYPAVQMFLETARHIDPNFSLEAEKEHVIQLCQLVEGTPLAIKLATSWLRSFTCRELVEEIKRDLDMLSTRLRDLPDQHRSLRTVFDHSWARLSDEEQKALKHLAIFQGHFSREAAQNVANASVAIVTGLIEKSLLNAEQNGYYSMHALLRQYVYEKLAKDESQLNDAYHRFAEYYGHFIARMYPNNTNEKQQDIMHAFVAEIDNIRAAWPRILHAIDAESMRKVIVIAGDMYQFLAYYREGLNVLTGLLDQATEKPPETVLDHAIIADLQVNAGWLHIRLGQISQAEALLEEARATFENHATSPLSGLGTDPRVALGIVRTIQGRYEEAIRLGEAAVSDNQAQGDLSNEAGGWYVLTSVALACGDFERASETVREAANIIEKLQDQWFHVYLLHQQGQIAIAKGEYGTAQRYFEQSFEMRDEFDDPEGMIAPLTYLAQIAVFQAEFERALTFFKRSQKFSQQIGDQGWWIIATEGIGSTYLALEDYEQAHTYLSDALLAAVSAELPALQLRVLASVARFLIETGKVEEGIQIASLAFNHSLTEHETRDITETILTQYRSALAPANYSAAVNGGKQMQLQTVIDDLRHRFPFYTWDATQTTHVVAPAQPLIEPLTDRELEVLHLLAQGFTNTKIAEELTVVLGTVKTHNYNIFGKLGVKNRVQAVKRARELNLI